MKPEIWIGLVHLKPLNREEFGAAGAFSNILTWATDADSFRSKAETIAVDVGMFVVAVENPQPLRVRFKNKVMPEEVEDMVVRAGGNPNAIVYGTFHTYPHDLA